MLREIKKHLRQYPSIRHNYRAVHRAVSKSAAMETYYRGALLSVDHPDIDEVPQKLDRPRSAYIEITNACNINCKMCSTKLSTRPPTIMSPELYEHTVVELKKIGIHGAPLHTVGETFVHRNLSQLLDISAKHNFQVYISTNAQFPDKIVELYREHPNLANSFRFSIDGATEKNL
jgi:MoaA/NifB/PqqE/SkfB family radical SAM enzyme